MCPIKLGLGVISRFRVANIIVVIVLYRTIAGEGPVPAMITTAVGVSMSWRVAWYATALADGALLRVVEKQLMPRAAECRGLPEQVYPECNWAQQSMRQWAEETCADVVGGQLGSFQVVGITP